MIVVRVLPTPVLGYSWIICHFNNSLLKVNSDLKIFRYLKLCEIESSDDFFILFLMYCSIKMSVLCVMVSYPPKCKDKTIPHRKQRDCYCCCKRERTTQSFSYLLKQLNATAIYFLFIHVVAKLTLIVLILRCLGVTVHSITVV